MPFGLLGAIYPWGDDSQLGGHRQEGELTTQTVSDLFSAGSEWDDLGMFPYPHFCWEVKNTS